VKTDTEGGELLKRRLMPFTVDNQSMKFVLVKVGNNGTGGIYRLPRSTKNGHFVGHVTLHHDELHDAEDGMLAYRAVDRDRIFEGFIHLLQSTGTSIISDIDDTLKITNYLDKREFLKNTFLREFVEVPGMKELFIGASPTTTIALFTTSLHRHISCSKSYKSSLYGSGSLPVAFI
jgi:hypothetical protein